MADFLAEIPVGSEGLVKQQVETTHPEETWELYSDGAASAEGSGAGLILTSPSGEEHTYALRYDFPASNNESEYEALLAGLRMAKAMDIKKIQVYVDSQLVANQICGAFEAKEPAMKKYLDLAKILIKTFEYFKIEHVPRSRNKKADALSKLASLTFAHLTKEVLVEVLKQKSIIADPTISDVQETGSTWMSPITEFLNNGILPEEPGQARKVRMNAPRYEMINGTLYRKTFLGPKLRCVGPAQAENIIREIHEGACGLHAGSRSIVSKIARQGYFWPSMNRDTLAVVQKCRACQTNAPVQHSPRHDLIPVSSAWPFHKWAIDIVGPFPADKGGVKFLVVAIDYFTKWVEAKPLSTITGNKILTFVWEDIVCRFGIPHEIVSDNGKQFADNPFKSWCIGLEIKQTFTSVAHPQANGQVEVTNRDIVRGIKARLDGCQNGWTEELPNVLWAHRTTPKKSTGETPYCLVYGSEAIIPAEISIPTLRVSHFDEDVNIAGLKENLDKVEERREYAAIKEAENKRRIAKYYNRRVHPLTFKTGDYVWRKNEASRAEGTGKLGPNWEGPYRVANCHGNGAYSLVTVNGTPIPRTWHATNLKKCYI